MTDTTDLFPKNLYHSYIIEGDPERVPFSLRALLLERGDIEEGSVDVLCQIYDSFSIEDSSQIKEWHSLSGVTNKKKICIIGTKFINHDAERTLLKMIEEPASGTHFFIVVPNAAMLLDTIVSRAHVVKMPEKEDAIERKSVAEFLASSPDKRMELVKEMVDAHKDNENSGGLRSSATVLVNGLEKIIHGQWKKSPEDPNLGFMLGELGKAREYLSLPGASVKMILEHISLVL